MKNLILPAFVMLIGAGTAFASGTAEKSENKLIPQFGYVSSQLGQCEFETSCDTNGNAVCTVGNTSGNPQVKGKREVDGVTICDVLLYQPQK